MRSSRPTPEQLAPLTRLERAAFEIADFLAQPAFTPVSAAWNSAFMGALIYSCGSRRLRIDGLSKLAGFGPRESVLIVANHRSFFDFFCISALCFWRTRLTKRIFFPVRENFFYDHPLGPPVNALMSGMRMFPPVMRDREKRSFNNYVVARCIEELDREDVGTILGMHPEGTRNKGDDPYALLPAQPGVGRVALGSKRAKVVPVFVLGMGQTIRGEWRKNLFSPGAHPIRISIGDPLDLSDLRPRAHLLKAQKRAADRCVAAIQALADAQRREAEGRP